MHCCEGGMFNRQGLWTKKSGWWLWEGKTSQNEAAVKFA
jgi:hypothetical protein